MQNGRPPAHDDPAQLRPDRATRAMARLPGWLVVLGFWSLFGLAESAKGYVTQRLRGFPASWVMALIGNMPWWYGWAAVTPLIVWLASRLRLDDDRHRLRSLAVHIPVSLVIAMVHLIVVGALYYVTIIQRMDPALLPGAATAAATITRWLNSFLILNLVTYWGVVGAWYAIDYARRYRESALMSARLRARAAQLELRAGEARMRALRMELNPHFLFNSLNAVAGLVRRQRNDEAVLVIAQLGDLLRLTLDRDAGQELPLGDELALLERYLAIERVRFADRLTVEMEIADAVRQALVPVLVLQPLVENAVRHGIARCPGPGRIRIAAHRERERLTLEVCDTGVGLRGSNGGTPAREGVGLSNTRARLEELYGSAAGLLLADAPGGGVCARLWLPYHLSAVEAHAGWSD